MTLAERLAEAEAALHDLMTGKLAVSLHDQNGEQITFAQASRSALQTYIADLRRQLGAAKSPFIQVNTRKGC